MIFGGSEEFESFNNKKEINFGEPEACVTLGRRRTFRGLSLKIN